jgi:hypothetical protein
MANRGSRPWDIGNWLRGLGLGQYEVTFREKGAEGFALPISRRRESGLTSRSARPQTLRRPVVREKRE